MRDEDDLPEPAVYRVRSTETWDLARDAYLSGETAAEVCARFDLGLSAFWDRARRGGWRRSERPDPQPLPLDADDDIDFDADYGRLAEDALRQLRRAMARGRASAAASWMRLHDRLTARAREQAQIEEKAAAAASTAAPARPVSVAVERFRERVEAERREAEAYVAARNGVARAPIETELSRLDAQRSGPAQTEQSEHIFNGGGPPLSASP